MLADRPHLQGLVLGLAMLAPAATGTPAALHAAQDLATMPSLTGKIATPDTSPKQALDEPPDLIAYAGRLDIGAHAVATAR